MEPPITFVSRLRKQGFTTSEIERKWQEKVNKGVKQKEFLIEKGKRKAMKALDYMYIQTAIQEKVREKKQLAKLVSEREAIAKLDKPAPLSSIKDEYQSLVSQGHAGIRLNHRQLQRLRHLKKEINADQNKTRKVNNNNINGVKNFKNLPQTKNNRTKRNSDSK